jgi:hypothetical protein
MMRTLVLIFIAIHVGASAASAQRYSPDDAPIETADVTRFWQAWDRLPAARTYQDTLRVFFEDYYLPGSPGLHDFVRARIGSVIQLVDAIRARPGYYASMREPSLRVHEFAPEMREVLRHWTDYVPDAQFPAIYFLIGRLTSGATVSPDRILVGTEMYGRTPDTPEDELSDWLRQVLAPIDGLPLIVAHELVHTQQPPLRDQRLLARVIREGSADFISELIAGGHINHHIHDWAEPRAAELWQDFLAVKHVPDNAGWLYGRRSDGEPNDLGYWIGYRIAKAYYERADDKRRAVREILDVEDFDAFLAVSGLGEELRGG